MYILKNALKSIIRTKSRNILIGIIIIVIAIASCVALSIKDAAKELTNSYKETYSVIAEISLDRSTMRQDAKGSKNNEEKIAPSDFMKNVPELSVAMIEKYGDSIYVKSYGYSATISLNGVDLTTASMQQNVDNDNSSGAKGNRPGGENFTGNGFSENNGDFTLVGYNSLEAMSEFVEGTYKISEGEIFDIDSEEMLCVITDELAEENGINVGDTITLSNPNSEDETFVLKVTGIYTDSSDSGEFSMFSRAANQIITSYSTVNSIVSATELNEEKKLKVQTTNSFNLTSSDIIDNFKEELEHKGLSNYYTVQTNVDSFEESIEPLENLSKFSTIFLIIVLLVGGSILIIINMLNVRERKYEIGVLRAIGMKRYKVLGQFIIELLIVTTIAIIIGTIIGSFLTVPTANFMLESQIESMQNKQNNISNNFGKEGEMSGGMSNFRGPDKNMLNKLGNSDTNFLEQLDAVVNGKIILQLAGIGMILTIISGSVSMIFISRYTPLKILSNRT